MPSEQQIQTKIKTYLESEGYYVVKVVTATKRGVPDLLCCINGKFVAFEVKRPSTKTNTSKLQLYNIKSIQKSGGVALVVWDLEQVRQVVEELKK